VAVARAAVKRAEADWAKVAAVEVALAEEERDKVKREAADWATVAEVGFEGRV
jgi:hypothetical protein